MPEISLTQVFCTLGIGIFSSLLPLYLFTIFYSPFLSKSKANKSPDTKNVLLNLSIEEKSGFGIISLVLLYGLGVFMQANTGYMQVNTGYMQNDTGYMQNDTAKKQPIIKAWNSTVSITTDPGFPNNKRYDVLFNKIIIDSTIDSTIKLSHLGIMVFSTDSAIEPVRKLLGLHFFDSANKGNRNYKNLEQEWDIIKLDSIKRAEFLDFANQLYYISKNWCMLHSENAYEELKDLQQRMDFAQGIGIISYFYRIILSIMIIPWFILLVIKSLFYTKCYLFNSIKFRQMLILLLVMFISHKLALNSYPGVINDYNKRVYGYYANHFLYGEQEVKFKVTQEK